ncbi:MAG TPA: hypothetical protein PLP26_16515 [Ilumatobacteraceae bacterium]|nr:hypothetical protein [Ilumatobacteraceae bacterium]
MIDDYRQRAARCESVNAWNKLHIDIENELIPQDIVELHDAARLFAQPPLRLRSRAWARRLYKMYSMAAKDIAEPFVATRLNDYVSAYTLTGRDAAPQNLLVCFTGNGGRLMMPVAVFLQHLDAGSTDVVVIRKQRGSSYQDGLPGLSASLSETYDVVSSLMPHRGEGYQRRFVLGTSAGGLPAVLAAVRWGFDRAVAVGAGSIGDPRWAVKGVAHFAEQFADARATSAHTTFLAVHGDIEADQNNAMELHALVGGERRCVPVPEHNCLYPLVQAGTLLNFVDEVLAGGR